VALLIRELTGGDRGRGGDTALAADPDDGLGRMVLDLG
jgi:hypothetical protein